MTSANRELSMNQLESVSGGANSGIGALIAVTQMKTSNANDDAMAGAAKKGPHKIG